MRISPSVLPFILSLSMVLAAEPAAGAAGDLDPSFGVGGKVITRFEPIGGRAAALVIQPDGKIVAAGVVPRSGGSDFTLVRYLPDGTLDASFGSGGIVTTVFPGRSSEVTALALQPDGKIVAAGKVSGAGHLQEDFGLARYHPDGSLDTGFGSGGLVTTDFGGFDLAEGVALLPDGRIAVAGTRIVGQFHDFAVALYESNGSASAGFGAGGRVVTDFFGRDDVARDVLAQPDGRIVAVGYAFSPVATRVALARYNLDGSLDPSFSGDGKATTSDSILSSELGFAAALQPDGRIVVAGSRISGANFNFLVERYLPNGSPDTSFGTGGWATLDFFGEQDEAHAVALQPGGGIVLAGFARNGPDFVDYDFALARYTPGGLLDTSFGAAGRVTTDFFGLTDQGYAAASQPDGRIVVAGYATEPDPSRIGQFALARYLGAVNAPPVITGVSASRTTLWPPNHKMIDVTVFYSVTDDRDPAPLCALSVTSNEPVNGTGDGDTAPDWQVVDAHRVRLRAERSGGGSGRVYTIVITCQDGDGASARQMVTVSVPRSAK
ncbi:MAG TPA: delta-60 repeat domain-containing protein [Thermoanaerobaculia bacterium]